MNARKRGEGKTPHRTIRVEDGLWDAARDRAVEEKTTLTAVVNEALRKFVAKPRGKTADE